MKRKVKKQRTNRRIKLFVKPGSIAHGRNVSIQKAAHLIIATIDSGCVAKKDWLERLIEPFRDKRVGLVAGFYEMLAKNSMQKAMNTFRGVSLAEFDPVNFVPSTRSMAFRKDIWRKVGKFSEELSGAGEDTAFFYDAVKLGVKIVRVGKARVIWQELGTLSFSQSLKKFYYYAKGDAQSGIWWHPSKRFASHNIKVIFVFFRYLLGLLLLSFSLDNSTLLSLLAFLVLLYFFWSFFKVYRKTADFKAGLWAIIIQIFSDIAVMAGFISGCIQRYTKVLLFAFICLFTIWIAVLPIRSVIHFVRIIDEFINPPSNSQFKNIDPCRNLPLDTFEARRIYNYKSLGTECKD
jgi:cellulose synthase/poly-beta-1,6-N-acetylglucosamine synthase-like glycosyltransferase